MSNLIVNIFNQDIDCITDLITFGFNVTHYERISIGVGKTALLVNINGLCDIELSIVEHENIKKSLYAYYADNPLEIIFQLPNNEAVTRIERWGFEVDDRLIRKPYDGKVNAGVCRSAVVNAQRLAQCKRIVNARKMAVDIADDCLKIAIKGGNKLKVNVDFDKIDRDELFACLRKMDYELTDSSKLMIVVSW